MASQDEPKISLRERKKMKTRATIQQNALRLFREQGYAATTVEQIAEISEVSPSTFFRYFPTKESVVFEDGYDPIIIEAYKRQPIELSPIQALREAVSEVFVNIPDEEKDLIRERIEFSMSIPELRAVALNQVMNNASMITELVAERVGRARNDLFVLTFSGAFVGAVAAMLSYYAQNQDIDFLDAINESLTILEKGLSL
ncbi:TetR family transcriptional regulator [Heyndrickxia sporothermodurans]|nr:TetR family transcriptional regulator [Heyndrickxia sporothermodurans]